MGQLFELYRNYLRLITRSMLDRAVQMQLDDSDLVQETFSRQIGVRALAMSPS